MLSMKKGNVIALFVLGLFMISFLAGVVSAATPLQQQIIDKFSLILSGDSTDYLRDILSPEVLFGLLIFLIVFAIVSKISLFGTTTWIKTTVSVVIAILAAGFIDVSLLKPILNQYTALGVMITLLLPFILLFYFLKEIAPNSLLLHRIIWWTFFVVVVVNAWVNWDTADSTLTKILYWAIIIGTLIMAIASRTIMNSMFKSDLESQLSERTKEAEVSLMAQIAQDKRKLEELKGAAYDALAEKIARNEKALAKMKA